MVRGALRQTPLAEFLVQAYDGGFEGTLLLQTVERKKSAIFFTRGAPAKARPAEQNVFLSEVAVDLGLIPRSVSVSTRKRAEATGKLHGQILREEGHVDETGLYVALREQLFRQVLLLCDLPDTTGFGFYRANYLADWGHTGHWRVKPLPMMWRALVDHTPPQRRDAWLARIGDVPIRMRATAPVSRYGLTQQEKGVVDIIRAMPSTVSKLSESGVGTPELVQKVVCALLLSRQIDMGFEQDPVGLHEPPETPQSVAPPETRAARRSVTAPRPSGIPSDLADPPSSHSHPPSMRSTTSASRPRTSTGPRPPEASSAEALRAEIEAYRARNPQNYYEVLGLDKSTNAAAVRAAFFQLARRWHPDRLPSELADLKPVVNKAFALMGEAHQTLMDDHKRSEYDRALQEAPADAEQEEVAAILRAAGAYQRGEILLKKKDYKNALKEATEAFEYDSTQPDHVALYAWLTSTQRTDNNVADLIALLDGALKTNPNHLQALWYRGQLHKKANQTLKAMKDFKAILEIKPNHVDAAREVRVYTMRRRSDPKGVGSSPKGGGGLFGAFKKKD